ncbi:hypothetical protein INR76_09555 [Marixanthomonas sp. SCSIO 43207]|uniref:contractile injection system tape measure protein n=1 Tax=Marixanthomonas sp. SCSIO 43207 TaxID=2779360 RepID=UPI001CA8129B|nr:contractile injection system tape measure protein [Marixanthomonas sp. SCSIO 43207]UAB80362.1 hypothetical protein INR76_09555 [Marixanthomonas sp. SCSIO 43207]
MEQVPLQKKVKNQSKITSKKLNNQCEETNKLIGFLETGFLEEKAGNIPNFDEIIFKCEDKKLFYSEITNEIKNKTNTLNRIILQYDNQIIKLIFLNFLDTSKSDLLYKIKIPAVLSETSYKIIFWKLLFTENNQQNFESKFKNLIAKVAKYHPKKKVIELLNFAILLQRKKPKNEKVFFTTPPIKKELKKVVLYNSGLVLLYPFFETLFKDMKYLKNNVFLPEKKQRAAHALHYLATQNKHSFEFQMQIEKLICGFALNQSIDRFIKLSDFEKETCNSFLQNVIKKLNFQGIKTVSELQTRILQREGTLMLRENLVVTVKKHNDDAFLSSLPFDIHKINLPWQTTPFSVKW